jgi:SPP1 family predicted phage head-tail adaptor
MSEFDWIGELRHKITIEAVQEVQDENGVIHEEWSTFLEVSAQVNPLAGVEAFQAQQLDARLDHRVMIRYRPGIKPKMRIRFAEPSGTVRYFDIFSVVNPQYRNQRLEIMCREMEVGGGSESSDLRTGRTPGIAGRFA